jgi:hypothetical protein
MRDSPPKWLYAATVVVSRPATSPLGRAILLVHLRAQRVATALATLQQISRSLSCPLPAVRVFRLFNTASQHSDAFVSIGFRGRQLGYLA